jgi:putative hemolysin
MNGRTTAAVAAVAALALVAAGVAGGAAAKTDRAAAYCKSKGGVVQTRTPAYGTNDPATQLTLAGPVRFCKFASRADGSRIYVSLATLYATRPTLAALAYLHKPKPPESTNGANPASLYCSKLGGSDSFGGVNAAGGGWVLKSDKDDPVLEVCVFPDGSMLDSWGLTYHANGIVRGADLTPILRYKGRNAPPVFQS